jgi:hypothetical protein
MTTLAQFIESRDSVPQGPRGPLGLPRYYVVTPSREEIAEAARLRFQSSAPVRRLGASVPRTRSASDERARLRLERHRRDAEHDALVQRLRRLR